MATPRAATASRSSRRSRATQRDVAPPTGNRAFTISADLALGQGRNGCIVACGSAGGGYVLSVRAGRLVFDCKHFHEHSQVQPEIALPSGRCKACSSSPTGPEVALLPTGVARGQPWSCRARAPAEASLALSPPRDKATAESAVQVVTRWVLAQLRHTVLADVHAADAAIAALMPSLNNRAFQKLDGSRASLFASLDSPALSPLPMQPWQWATFKKVTVHIDYHVEVEAHRYSVPHPLVGLEMEARITDALVEVLHRGQRVACHARNEDVDGPAGRGFERPMLMSLALSRWVEDGTAILITGPAGSGKSWLACALAQYACRRGQSALYLRAPRLAEELRIQHGNGGFARWLGAVARTDVLVLDDWGLATLDGPTRSDLLEIIDDRAGTRATIVTSQLPVEHWHAWIGDATIADAILDRLLSRSQRLALKGK